MIIPVSRTQIIFQLKIGYTQGIIIISKLWLKIKLILVIVYRDSSFLIKSRTFAFSRRRIFRLSLLWLFCIMCQTLHTMSKHSIYDEKSINIVKIGPGSCKSYYHQQKRIQFNHRPLKFKYITIQSVNWMEREEGY